MSADRFAKVYDALRVEFPDRGDVTLVVGISEASGDTLVCFQESAEPLVTDNVRQVRTIGVRLIAVSVKATRSQEIMKRATDRLDATEGIRVFDMTGPAVDLDADGPAADGVFLTSQRVDLR